MKQSSAVRYMRLDAELTQLRAKRLIALRKAKVRGELKSFNTELLIARLNLEAAEVSIGFFGGLCLMGLILLDMTVFL